MSDDKIKLAKLSAVAEAVTTTTEYSLTGKNTVEDMYRIRDAFISKWGKEPVAWIISAQDYLQFIEIIKYSTIYGYEFQKASYPNTFMGLPIRLKRSGQIELEIPFDMWSVFAMGVTK